jgi:hypothetical protein
MHLLSLGGGMAVAMAAATFGLTSRQEELILVLRVGWWQLRLGARSARAVLAVLLAMERE